MDNPLKPILAGLGPQLADLERSAKERSTLLTGVKALLPPAEAQHVVAVSYRDSVLTIVSDSAAWCARLRYCESTLRRDWLATSAISFTKLRFTVGKYPSLGTSRAESAGEQ